MKIRLLNTLFFFIFFHALGQSEAITVLTWNIRDLGQSKSDETLEAIATMVKNVDILAIQEVVSGYGGAQAVAKLTDMLNRKGAKWDYVISDATNSPRYCTERYAYIWKTKAIKIKNRGMLIEALDQQVDREPFLMEFYWKGKKITIVNFHSRPFRKNPKPEIMALSNYIVTALNGPVLLLGDFNTKGTDAVFTKLLDHDYKVSVRDTKTTLKQACEKRSYLNYAIDNIWYSKEIVKLRSGVIDFVKNCERLQSARKLSDHLPVYVEFRF